MSETKYERADASLWIYFSNASVTSFSARCSPHLPSNSSFSAPPIYSITSWGRTQPNSLSLFMYLFLSEDSPLKLDLFFRWNPFTMDFCAYEIPLVLLLCLLDTLWYVLLWNKSNISSQMHLRIIRTHKGVQIPWGYLKTGTSGQTTFSKCFSTTPSDPPSNGFWELLNNSLQFLKCSWLLQRPTLI